MNKKLKEQLELVIIQCSALKAQLDEAVTRNQQYEAEIEQLRSALEQLQKPCAAPVAEALEIPPEETPMAQAEQTQPLHSEAAPAVTETAEPAATTETTTPMPAAETVPEATPSETAMAEAPPATEPHVPESDDTAGAAQEAQAAPPAISETMPAADIPAMPVETPEATETAQTQPPEEDAPEAQSFQNILETGAELVSQAVATSKEYIRRLEAAQPESHSLADIIRSRTDLFKVEISGIIGGFGTAAEKREKMNTALVKLIQYFENVK